MIGKKDILYKKVIISLKTGWIVCGFASTRTTMMLMTMREERGCTCQWELERKLRWKVVTALRTALEWRLTKYLLAHAHDENERFGKHEKINTRTWGGGGGGDEEQDSKQCLPKSTHFSERKGELLLEAKIFISSIIYHRIPWREGDRGGTTPLPPARPDPRPSG